MTWIMPVLWCLTAIVVIGGVIGTVGVIMALLAMRDAEDAPADEGLTERD